MLAQSLTTCRTGSTAVVHPFFFEIAHFFREDSVRPGESPSRLLPPSPIDHHRMRSTFAWREPDVGRRLATVRRTYSWELPRAPVSPDEGARAAAVCGTPAHERASEPTVDVRDAGVQLHDPSAIVAEGGRYFLYSTSYAHADAHGNGAREKR